MLTAPGIETLKKSLRGTLFEPADVAACVGFAREHGVPLSVRGGLPGRRPD